MNIYQEFLPTFLYIKRHKITGKLYFGKTTKNPEVYKGSGTHWLSHIKKHGKEHIETLWYCLYTDKELIKKSALSFSKLWNIVESKEWLNLVEENGIGGNINSGYKHKDSTKKKISNIHKGKLKSEKHKQNLRNCNLGKKHLEETKNKMSKSQKNRITPEWLELMKKNSTGKFHSLETKNKISQSKIGKKRNPFTKEHKLKTSATLKQYVNDKRLAVVKCPHCPKLGKEIGMKRWHFNNCKLIN